MAELKKVGVLGGGMMGCEIAWCFANIGCDVVLKDMTLEFAEKGKNSLEKPLARLIKKGKITEDEKAAGLARITPVDNYDLFTDVDLVIEAIFEDLKIKQENFKELDKICKPECVIATNTSSLSVTKLASVVGPDRVDKFVGMHFFSPVSVMRLVEVVAALETSDETIEFAIECCKKIGKTAIKVKDVPGFALNRLLMAMNIEAIRLITENVISPEDIEVACRLGAGYPMGPFTLMDLTGLDLNLKIAEIFFEAYGERYMPPPLFKQKVDANHLGRKTGKGFLNHEKK